MLQLTYALKKHNNWGFPTPSQSRISFERTVLFKQIYKYLETRSDTRVFYNVSFLIYDR
jgi:hypothetical protein